MHKWQDFKIREWLALMIKDKPKVNMLNLINFFKIILQVYMFFDVAKKR